MIFNEEWCYAEHNNDHGDPNEPSLSVNSKEKSRNLVDHFLLNTRLQSIQNHFLPIFPCPMLLLTSFQGWIPPKLITPKTSHALYWSPTACVLITPSGGAGGAPWKDGGWNQEPGEDRPRGEGDQDRHQAGPKGWVRKGRKSLSKFCGMGQVNPLLFFPAYVWESDCLEPKRPLFPLIADPTRGVLRAGFQCVVTDLYFTLCFHLTLNRFPFSPFKSGFDAGYRKAQGDAGRRQASPRFSPPHAGDQVPLSFRFL